MLKKWMFISSLSLFLVLLYSFRKIGQEARVGVSGLFSAIWFGIIPILLISPAFASEEFTPAGSKQGAEIFVQLGHSGVQSVAFSKNGAYALSSGDKAVKLWDVGTGREIRTFTGHTAFVSSAVFSPDERFLLSCGMDNMIILWDLESGKQIRTFNGHTKGVFAAVFAPDGRHIASGSMDNTIKIWELSTGRVVTQLTGHTATVRSLAFSPDGRLLVSGSWDRTIKLWDAVTGTELRTLTGHTAAVNAVAISPDGKRLLSAGGKDKTVRYWEVESGRELAVLRGHTNEVSSVAFSPDGRTAASGGWDRTVKVWDIADTGELKSLPASEGSVFSVAFSPDGRYLLAGSRNMSLWDIAAAKEVRKLDGKVNWVRSAAFSPNGLYAVSGNFNGVVNLWDIVTGRLVRSMPDVKGIVSSLSFTPDGRSILDCRADGPVKLWDVESGKERLHLHGQGAAAMSPDGKLIAAGAFGNSLKLWDVETGNEGKTLSGHTDKIHAVVFSPDGKLLLSGSRDKTVRLWDVGSGRELRVFRDFRYHVNSVAFSPDGAYALTAGFDGIPKLLEVATGKRVMSFQGHKLSVYSAIFSADGKRIITGSGDGTVRIWDINSGREISQSIGFTNGEWIVITPEGYYNSSSRGHEHLNIRRGNKVYGIDQFYDVFYRPDIVAAKLRGEDISSLITLTIDDAIKNPPPSVEFTSLPKDAIQPKVKVCYKVKGTGGGIGEVRLFHNGKLIESDGFYRDIAKLAAEKTQLAALNSKAIYEDMRGVIVKGKADTNPIISKSKGELFEDCKEVDSVSGENEVSLSAFNSSNTVQSYMQTAKFNSTMKPEEPHLYILSIGIDQYKDKSVNLKYALKDAKDIKEKLLSQSATLYKPRSIHHEMFIDKDATKTNILNKINEISQKIKPSDSFILFVAGHGILLQNQYYMLTSEYDGNINENTMISSNEIVEISRKLKSLSQLFIFDTCHAGGVDYIVSGLYDARMSVLARKMGLHIYASANSKEAAMDGYQGNGLFTYTLLDGLNNKKEADKNNDKKVSLIELGEYSKMTTTDISNKIGHSQTPLIINFGRDNPVYNLR